MRKAASRSCLADGTKLRPMVIFRSKRKPQETFPPGVLVHFHETGWMDELWIGNVWKQRPGHANERSLLVWDSFRGHTARSTTSCLRECKVEAAVIPGGLTSILQPLDVSLNKPFKNYIREEWTTWMANGQHAFTAGGHAGTIVHGAVPFRDQCVE
uniref:DDE-1 domain-containing protein n=1 Tax=Trichuris muris TaxID=70415 RepID=A0A5S6QMK0_TRIMR